MIFRLVLCCLLAATGSLYAGVPPLGEGETFTYKVSWAVIPGAGEIKVTAQNDNTSGVLRRKVTTTTATKGFARIFLKFNATASSVFDLSTGRLVALSESSEQGDKKAEHAVAFDYKGSQAMYTVPGAADKSRTLVMPAGEPFDLITCLIQTRTWNLKPGESRDVLVLFDDDFYELTIHALRYEKVRTSLGSYDTLLLEPRMEKTPLKGMFKRGSSVHVWISQDEQRLPVKFEVEFKVGTGTATLTKYEPPTTPAPATESKKPEPAKDEKNPRP